ncbi:MAG TPA: hypothetical protein VFP23_06625 [Solirubrobacterales bacterium]|nr:hypothetical protein [Solirubrobacterales bacterium]
MLGTYASAALICAASLLVGRALLAIAGRAGSWSWLEGATGLGAMLTVSGVLARAPGHGTTATAGLVLLIVVAAAVAARAGREEGAAEWRRELGRVARRGAPVALAVALVLSIPFAVSGRWGLLGVGFNNDLGLHLAWAEWLRSGFGPAPDAGYPLGPHGLAVAAAAVPGIGLGEAFVGEILAIGVLTGLTALGALDELGPVRRTLAALLVAVTYLGASSFAQGTFKEMAEALLVLAFAVGLHLLERRRWQGGRPLALPFLALAGGILFSYSFAGLAWPVAIAALWSLTLPEVRAALAPGRLMPFLRRPATLAALAALVVLAVLLTVAGPFGFAGNFEKVAGSNTYGPVSPVEALGIWPTSNYRLNAAGGAHLTGLAAAIAILAVALGAAWWARRRLYAVPIALAASLLLYLLALPFSGDYSLAKALTIAAPLAMLVAIRPLLSGWGALERTSSRHARTTAFERREAGTRGGVTRVAWAALTVVFVAGAAYSSFLVLRDAPVGPPGHGGELRAFLPILHGKPVLYAGQDRYAAYELLGADTHVPLVEFPDPSVSANPEKPFDTGDAYSPIDFDSFSRATLDRFPYVITSRAAWNSEAPADFRRVAATPSYLLWKRTGPAARDRHVLLEGTEAGAPADCAAPEVRILLANPGRAGLFPTPAIGLKTGWNTGSALGTGERASQTLRLGPGRWLLSLQYFSPFALTLTAPGLREPLKPALDGQRPSAISLANDGQFWPAGEVTGTGGAMRFTIATAEPSALQRLTGYDGKAYLGELVAVPARRHRIVPLSQACGSWIDWYEADAAP